MKRRARAGAPSSVPVPELIRRKREGGKLSDVEIQSLIEGYVKGAVPDYQMSALAMAIFFRGLSPEETSALTLAMRDSGSVVAWPGVRGKLVDKHSTGGVGDKVSICLAPIVAACGVKVPMVSGRALGHSGGTLDKLEAIPGFRVDQSTKQFVAQVKKLGCALIGQTEQIAPADKRLYALRDVTATVENIALITASILSKKLAEGIDALVLDVKVGRGAFMATREDGRALAQSIVRVGHLAGKNVTAFLTSMDQPLGNTVGNALETREALEVLTGEGPEDLVELTSVLGAEMLRLAGVAKSESEARRAIVDAIRSGRAADRMEAIVAAQHGDRRVVRERDRLPRARYVAPVLAKWSGFVTGIEAKEIGLTAMALGAGRARTDDAIDHSVGIVLQRKIGDAVRKGDVIAELHLRRPADGPQAATRIQSAFEIGARRPRVAPLVFETIRR